jgi:site-specific DNA recombinase
MFTKTWSPGRVAIYLRVSSDEQREQQTIAAQRRQVRTFCQRHELNVVAEYEDDGISGESEITSRVGGGAMIRAAERGEFDTLYVAAVDRIGRAAYYVLHAEHLLSRAGIKLQSVTEPFDPTEVTGKLLLALLAGKAGADKQTIYDRTESGKAQSLSVDDRYLGGVVPFGYLILWEGQRKKYAVCSDPIPNHPDWSPALVISYCFRRSREGATDLTIATELDSFGLPTCWIPGDRRYDTPVYTGWTMHRVRDLLSNPFYAGRQLWGKKQARRAAPIERSVPAIVTWEDYQASAATRKKNRTMSDRNCTRFNLLRGKIRCAHCGATYVGSPGYNSLRTCYIYQCYRNRNDRHENGYCRSKWVNAAQLEAAVRADIEGFLRRPEEFLDELRLKMGNAAQEVENHLSQADTYDKERQALDKQEMEFYRMRSQGIIATDDKLKTLLLELQQRAATLGRLVQECREKATAAVHSDMELNAAAALVWELNDRVDAGFSDEEWRRLVDKFVVGIVVSTSGEGRRKVATTDITYRVGTTVNVTTGRVYIWCDKEFVPATRSLAQNSHVAATRMPA